MGSTYVTLFEIYSGVTVPNTIKIGLTFGKVIVKIKKCAVF